MNRFHRTLLATAIAAVLTPTPSTAAVFGSLGNFDVVNDTGKNAYGFEIDIEDPSFNSSKITSVFGLNRVFSFVSPDPAAVVRFGAPQILNTATGVSIIYGGKSGASGIFTPSAPFATTGESCWPGANPGWKSTSCDHFGVSTYGNPAKTTYNWLVDDGAGGVAKQVVGIPMVSFVIPPYVAPPPPPPPAPGLPPAPPPPPLPPVVQAVIQAPVVVAPAPEANAFWVKITTTTLPENVDLGDLLGGNHPGARPQIAALKDKPEIETEWQPLQVGAKNGMSEVLKAVNLNGDKSAVITYQFFKYQGQFDGEGLVDPISAQFPHMSGSNAVVDLADPGNPADLRNLVYVGQQIAGFNAVQDLAPIAGAVPEPESWALMLAGLSAVGLSVRRRRAARRA